MWISKEKWYMMEKDLISIRGQVELISRFLGIPIYNKDTENQREPEKLHVAAQLLRQTAELLEEVNLQEKN